MTMGTATVARTKVRRTGLASLSQGPMARFSTVRVGNTATQIMMASWCFVGGPTGFGAAAEWALLCEVDGLAEGVVDMVVLLVGLVVSVRGGPTGPRGRSRARWPAKAKTGRALVLGGQGRSGGVLDG